MEEVNIKASSNSLITFLRLLPMLELKETNQPTSTLFQSYAFRFCSICFGKIRGCKRRICFPRVKRRKDNRAHFRRSAGHIYILALNGALFSQIFPSLPTAQGQLSPLPPIEVLQRLHRLITDHKNIKEGGDQSAQIHWSLLRQNVLTHLAGVIGADGRGTPGGVGGRGAILRQKYSLAQVGMEF